MVNRSTGGKFSLPNGSKLLTSEEAQKAHAGLLEGAEMIDRLRLAREMAEIEDEKEEDQVGTVASPTQT